MKRTALLAAMLLPFLVFGQTQQPQQKERLIKRATASNGNVYYSIPNRLGTVVHDPSGKEIWRSLETNAGTSKLFVDKNNNCYLVGKHINIYRRPGSRWSDTKILRDSLLIVKYNSIGVRVWRKALLGFYEFAEAAADSNGNLYLTGNDNKDRYSKVPHNLVKLTSDGEIAWTTSLDHEVAKILVTSGCIYTTGMKGERLIYKSACGDIATSEIDSNGVMIWTAHYDHNPQPESHNQDRGTTIAVTINGDVYVAGRSANDRYENGIIIKYDRNGIEKWVARHNRPGADVSFSAILVNGEKVYATRVIDRKRNWKDEDILTATFDDGGNFLWERTWGNPEGEPDSGSEVSINNENVVIKGYSHYPFHFIDRVLVYNARTGKKISSK